MVFLRMSLALFLFEDDVCEDERSNSFRFNSFGVLEYIHQGNLGKGVCITRPDVFGGFCLIRLISGS